MQRCAKVKPTETLSHLDNLTAESKWRKIKWNKTASRSRRIQIEQSPKNLSPEHFEIQYKASGLRKAGLPHHMIPCLASQMIVYPVPHVKIRLEALEHVRINESDTGREHHVSSVRPVSACLFWLAVQQLLVGKCCCGWWNRYLLLFISWGSGLS